MLGFVLLLLVPLSLATAQEKAEKKEKLDLKELFEKGIPESPFISVVYRYADTMLEHGRDTYGPKHTGLFLSALDRETLSPLAVRPAAPVGVPPECRPGRPGQALRGADPQLDQNLLRLLYFLRGLSGQDRYPKAADAGLKWFLQNAQSAATGLYPWGERLSWETFDDEVAGASGPVYEFSRPWMLWAKCFELAPEASERFARSLRDRELSPEEAGREPDPRQAGFAIRTWAEAHAHTGDLAFTRAIDILLERLERRRRSGPASSFLSLAIDCDGAARKVPEPLRTRLTRHAAREDEAFCSLPHDLETSRGFVLVSPHDPHGASIRSPRWDPRRRGETTARVAMMCVSRYENTGRVRYRDLITAAAGAYLDSLPGAKLDAWPMTFGHAISLELSAFRITADRKYFRRAFELGEVAVKEFFGDSPLPRASLKTNHYESTTGADTLVLALTELHLTTRTITAVRAPVNTIDR